MNYSDRYLQRLLDQALERIDVPDGCAVLLEGSLAAGFGNSSSDFDFLVVEDGDREHLTMPTVLFVDGRRVEVRMRSLRQLREQAEAVVGESSHGRARTVRIPEDRLNRCQRLSCARPLRNLPLAARAKDLAGGDSLVPLITTWFEHRAAMATRRAVAMVVLAQPRDAQQWARTAILLGAKRWLAARGETYLERKWVSTQMARVPDTDGLRDRFWELLHRPGAADIARYVENCVELNSLFGVAGCSADADRVSLRAAPGVTTWQIGDRVHVVRGRRDVFVLGPEATRVWRSLTFSVPLRRLLRATPLPSDRAGQVVAEMERLGLVGLAWRGRGTIAATAPVTPPVSTHRPVLSLEGAAVGHAEPAVIERVALDADRFVSAGMSLIWTNVMLENAREDVLGAVDGGQWETAAAAVNRMLRQACLSLLSAYGFSPAPPAEIAAALVARLPGIPAPVRERALEVEESLTVSDGRSAERALAAVDDVVAALRGVAGTATFPSSFDSADQWRSTLELGYDWARLGGYLSAEFPLEEARDIITTAGDVQRADTGTARAG